MSTSRMFGSTIRAVARRAATKNANAPVCRHSAMRAVARRGYASGGHGSAGAEKTSDMPWLIGSVGVTVPGAAWLISKHPKKSAAHHGGDEHHAVPVPDEEKAPAVESGAGSRADSDSDSDSGDDSSSAQSTPESSDAESDAAKSSSSDVPSKKGSADAEEGEKKKGGPKDP